MRWTRIVLLTRVLEADGEAVWSRRLDAGVKFRGEAMSTLRVRHAGLAERRWQKSPIAEESAE
jgi:hypothetical protein